jgi:hypothetical protein
LFKYQSFLVKRSTMRKTTQRPGRLATLAVAALGLIAVALPLQSASAQGMYLGWDFGNGFGIGIGAPPSAYGYHYCGLVATYQPCYYGY